MPKHQAPLQKLVDPFSILAQMNNLGVLIVAYVAEDIYKGSSCSDTAGLSFLYFIYYGSTIVCGGTFLLSLLYMVGLLDYCINKVMPCGQVCLTLNTLTIFLAGLIYHFIATIYGVLEMYLNEQSTCVSIQMFTRVTCTSYLIWIVAIVGYILVNVYRANRKKSLPTVEETYIEFKEVK